jgi:hypothetical protein
MSIKLFVFINRNWKANALLFVCFLLFKFNTVNAQNRDYLDFSISYKNLSFLYQDETDFEDPKKISDAFRLEINQKGRRSIVTARTIANLNQSVTMLPTNLFSIQMSSTNSNLNSSYRSKFNLDFTEQVILRPASSANRDNTYYVYDLHVDAIGYDYDPGQYFYTILFTITEQ